MKVLIAGAGQVGFNIARYLAATGYDVTIIDQRVELVQKIGDSLDIQAMVGHASHPERAGAGRCRRRRHADRRHARRRGQHGGLQRRAHAVQRADQDRPHPPAGLSGEPLAGPVPLAARADRRDHLARGRGGAGDRAAARGAGRAQLRPVRRRPGAAGRPCAPGRTARSSTRRCASSPTCSPTCTSSWSAIGRGDRFFIPDADDQILARRRGPLRRRDRAHRPCPAGLRPRGAAERAAGHRRRRQCRPVPRAASSSARHPEIDAQADRGRPGRAPSWWPTGCRATVVLQGDVRDRELLEEANVGVGVGHRHRDQQRRDQHHGQPAGQAARLPAAAWRWSTTAPTT